MMHVSHLERMGRELKCPICLSLLHSSVSLSCNHVFCNICIEKSMKSTSGCPVCKVPFRRREIRPAPHMDNLVSVYKSMEAASGVNIFVTQNADSGNIFHEDNETGVNACKVEGAVPMDSILNQGKQSKDAPKSDKRPAGSNAVRPSFPTKKRVQVPQYPSAGTQMEEHKLDAKISDNYLKERETSVSEKYTSTNKMLDLRLSPFFSLRKEECPEKSSQQTDDNQVMDTPPFVPCFSDIKDSDDEGSFKRSPERETCAISNGAYLIDSEMFEWTQRPCSPELCSSPQSMQVEESAEHEETPKRSIGCRKVSRVNIEESLEMYTEEFTSTTETQKYKRIRRTLGRETPVPIESEKTTKQDIQECNQNLPLSLDGKHIKDKKACYEASSPEEPLATCNVADLVNVSPVENVKRSIRGSGNSKRFGKNNKNSMETVMQPKQIGNKHKSRKSEAGKVQINAENHNEVMISASIANSLPLSNVNGVSGRNTKRSHRGKKHKLPNSFKKVSVKDNCNSNPLAANVDSAVIGQILVKNKSSAEKTRVQTLMQADNPLFSPNSSILVQCNTSTRTIQCAFCQSSEESEASGILVRYVNGKLVSEYQDAAEDSVYVHKNCAEWAPNVYFEDDNVINLESELSRSRRIACCCCGTKGAALGCYEKSCRKSFHVTCARLTPECRWDSDNFVILCPIHASSLLPNEIPQSETKQKRKPATQRKSVVHQMKTTDECASSSTLPWKSHGKFTNLIICCSALTTPEQEIVTQFEKLSGVTILKKWDSSVTHVIASTNENGACKRTLKYLMGVLEGKWIVSVEWTKACMIAGDLVDEQQHEISVDIHGISDGPKFGRFRLLNKQPKLFEGYTFFFMGDFLPSYRGYLHDLVIAGGGKVLNRKPVAETTAVSRSLATTFIIYSCELPDQSRQSPNGSSILNDRRSQAEALASSTGAIAASNSWILNSISGYRLQNIGE